MILDWIELEQFRNYSRAKFAFSPEGVVLSGANGIGKTNLLEAVSYLGFGRSVRARSDVDLIRFGQEYFRVSAGASYGGVQHGISASMNRQLQKNFKIDGVSLERTSDLYKHLKSIYFSPADVDMIAGPPAGRRQFFDQAISQVSLAYLTSLRKYVQILKQRNALLKQGFDPAEKSVWDRSFVEIGVEIVHRRMEYLNAFQPVLEEKYKMIAGNREAITLRYLHWGLPNPDSTPVERFGAAIEYYAEKEALYGRTLFGPHLDDFDFRLDDKPARQFASQGQCRSISLAARISQAALISWTDEEPPILMFDDVLAELDKERATRVLDLLEPGQQVFIATPNVDFYLHLGLPVISLDEFFPTSFSNVKPDR